MKNKIFLSVLVLAIIIICDYLVIKFILLQNESNNNDNNINNNNCEVEVGELYANYGKKKIIVNSIDTNVDIGDEKKYTRIGLTIEETNGTDADMDAYLFEIADKNREVISMCQTAAISENDKMIDIIPAKISANDTVTGYLYCETTRKDVDFLRISYVYEAKYDKDGTVKPDYKVLLIHLN